MTRRLDKAIAAIILLALAFTALAHGAVEPWSIALLEALAILAALTWAWKAIAERRLRIEVPSSAWPIAALVALGMAQSVAVEVGGKRLSLSMDAEATRRATALLFFMLLLFITSANHFTGRERLRGLVNFMVAFGLGLAVFALAQHFTWNGNIYWLRPNTQGGTPFGPFVNRNHFAGYMEMIIPVPLALVILRAARGEARLFYAFAAAVMGTALVASLSRGGMLSLAASLVFIAAAGAQVKTRLRGGHSARSTLLHPASLLLVVGVAIIAGIIWVGPDPVLKRIAEDQPAQGAPQASRPAIWRDSLAMAAAHPALGVGLGAFATAYPIYSRGDGSIAIEQAHNDYLQVLADAGIIGLVLALWFIATIFRAVFRGARSRDPFTAALALGSGGGILAMLVHSFVDFNLQLPSNALMFLTLSAVATRAGRAVESHSIPAAKASPDAREWEAVADAAPRYARGVQS